jgi:murein DD-endopeptidase MepM/ murein hydrolase activator NlpD/LysM repeat protein
MTVRSILWLVLGVLVSLALAIAIATGLSSAWATRQLAPTPRRLVIGEGEGGDTALGIQGTSTPLPSATPLPPTATPLPPGPFIHVIEGGDTLFGLALEYDVTMEDILIANSMSASDILHIGQEVIIPIEPPTPEPTATAVPGQANTSAPSAIVAYACSTNAIARPLVLASDPIRLVLLAGQAYFVAGGELYAVPLNELEGEGLLAPSSAMPPAGKVGKYSIRELVYAAVDPNRGDLILLDKSGDIYRRTGEQEWRLELAVAPIPGQSPDPLYLAVQSFGGSLYALDADSSRIWKLAPGTAVPTPYYTGGDISLGLDMAIPSAGAGSGTLMVLTRDGRALKFVGGQRDGTYGLQDGLVGADAWPAQVIAAGERLAVVDGQGRRVIGLDAASGQVTWQVVFRFPAMQRLRSAAVAGDTLYALAGKMLYITHMSTLGGDCPPVTHDDIVYFDGVDIKALTAGFKLPFPTDSLPEGLRFYPGARRLYRYGVHEGMDLYGSEIPGLGIGSPVLAVADGTVVRADTTYQEMTAQEYEKAITRAEAEHRTPPEWEDRLLGRQVHLLHAFGVESRYAHLSAIAPGLKQDDQLTQGDLVGRVGASGTSSAIYNLQGGAHLHLELWINGRYLGQGLSLYETKRLWQAVFE